MNASTIISSIIEVAPLSVVIAIARTSRRNYKIFRFKIGSILERHLLIDARTICRYDLIDIFIANPQTLEATRKTIKYCFKYNATKILDWIIDNRDTNKIYMDALLTSRKYIYKYNHPFKQFLPSLYGLCSYEKYYNQTLHELYEYESSNRHIDIIYTKYAVMHNYIDDFKMFVRSDIINYNKALSAIITSGNNELLKYIPPSQISKNFYRKANKANNQTVLTWLNKNIPIKCICGRCSLDNYKCLSKKYDQAMCLIHNNYFSFQDSINYLFAYGDAKTYLQLLRNNHIFVGNSADYPDAIADFTKRIRF